MEHITLITGHSVPQKRESIRDDVIVACSDMLETALTKKFANLPMDGGKWLLTAAAVGGALVATLHRGPWKSRLPILTVGVALDEAASKELWPALHGKNGVPTATNILTPPAAPWIGDRIELGMMACTEAAMWTGDFSRCLAWAWASLHSRLRRGDN